MKRISQQLVACILKSFNNSLCSSPTRPSPSNSKLDPVAQTTAIALRLSRRK
jgi:hypothetical protein